MHHGHFDVVRVLLDEMERAANHAKIFKQAPAQLKKLEEARVAIADQVRSSGARLI